MMKNKGIAFRFSFLILTSCSLIFLILFGYNYLFSRKIISKRIEQNARNLAFSVVNKIDSVFFSIAKVPMNLSYVLQDANFNQEEIIQLLEAVVSNNDGIFGATIAFEPYAFDPNKKFFAPYFYKEEGSVKFRYLTYDYFNSDWYRLPKISGASMWTEPYYDKGGGEVIMTTYSVPFYEITSGKKKFRGIITADISLTWLEDFISRIKIGKTGYGFVISKEGTIVSHPNKTFIMNKTIFMLASERDDSDLHEVGMHMVSGKTDFRHFKSILTSKKSWIVYTPLGSNSWSFGAIFPKVELQADLTSLNATVFVLAILGFLFLFIVIVFISKSITRPIKILDKKLKNIAKGKLNFELERAENNDEVGRLTDTFIYMRDELKKYIKELKLTTAAKEKIESELDIAHDIQQNILPKIFPAFPNRQEIDMYAVLDPARQVGGDLYDFFFIDEERLCFVIGDVSDKGVPAALFMAVTKTLVKIIASSGVCPSEILRRLNEELIIDNSSCMFVTCFCGILNVKTGEVIYANAGHNPPVILKREQKTEFLKVEQSPVIGVVEDIQFKRERIALNPGDTIYLYTDGVTEAFNEAGKMFGEERLLKFLEANKHQDPQELTTKSLHKVKTFVASATQSDDITILTLRYNGKMGTDTIV